MDVEETTRHNYRVNRILAGEFFDPGQVLEFDEVSICLDQLPQWTQKTETKARNQLTHHDEQQQPVTDHRGICVLADSVYLLVTLCLLKECRVAEESLMTMQTAPNIDLLHQRIDQVLVAYRESSQR